MNKTSNLKIFVGCSFTSFINFFVGRSSSSINGQMTWSQSKISISYLGFIHCSLRYRLFRIFFNFCFLASIVSWKLSFLVMIMFTSHQI